MLVGEARSSEAEHSLRAESARRLLGVSRILFCLTYLVLATMSSWRQGLMTLGPTLFFAFRQRAYGVGLAALLPVLTAATWLAGHLLQRPRQRWRWGPRPVAIPVLGFGMLAFARAWPAHDVQTSLSAILAVALLLGGYLYAIQNLPQRYAIALFVTMLLVHGVVGILQFLNQRSLGLLLLGELNLRREASFSLLKVGDQLWLRAYGLTSHPNILAGHLCLWLLPCLGHALSLRRGWASRLYLWVGLASGTLALLFTFSRSGWLGAFLAVCYALILLRRDLRRAWHVRARFGMILVLVLAICVLVAFTLAYGDLLAARLQADNDLEQTSIRERLIDAGEAWKMIREQPLVGVGTGYYLGALRSRLGEHAEDYARLVHNIPLLATAEMGVGGGVFWLWMLLGPPLALWWRSRTEPVTAGRVLWAAALIAVAVISFLDHYWYPPSAQWRAIGLGVLLGVWARQAEQSPEG